MQPMETSDFNRNDKQKFFNQIKGVITELNDGQKFGSVTLELGHENKRSINLIIKKASFDAIREKHKEGDRVCATFYITSRKNDRGHWQTMANLLELSIVSA